MRGASCLKPVTMMKLGTVIPYLNNIEKRYKLLGTPLNFCWHQYFSSEISNFCYIKKYRYRLHFNTWWFLIPLTFFESLKDVVITMVSILMMSAKLATLGLLKLKYFEIKIMTSWFPSMISPTKAYHVIQIIL